MDRKCIYCGAELAGFELYCPECGRELTNEEPAAVPEQDILQPGPAADPDDWFTVHDDDEVPQLRRSTVRPARMRETKPTDAADDLFTVAEKPSGPAETPAQRYEEPAGAYRYDAQDEPPAPRYDHRPARRTTTATAGRRTAARTTRPPQRARRAHAAAQPLSPRQRTMLLAGLGVLLVLLIIGGARMLFGGDDRVTYPFTPVVDRYFAAVRTANANTYIATRPDDYTRYLTTGSGSAYENESDYRAQTASVLHARLAEYQAQFGTIRSIDYELTSVLHYAHRCEALSEVLTGWYSFPENAVSDAYIVSGSYTVRGDNGSADYTISELLLIKIGSEWYFSPDAGSYWRAE